MRDRYRPILRALGVLIAMTALCVASAGLALADIVGRLKFTVKNAEDEKPLANAKIILKDSANVRPDVTLTTDAQGTATSPPLENRAWQITTTAEKSDTFEPDKQTVTVVADTTTNVEVLLEPVKPEKVITVTGSKDLVDKSQPATQTHRDQNFQQEFPATAGNPQNLGNVLETAPGFVKDSSNQVHPRGEHSSTTIFVNGFELPDALAGRAGAFLAPEAIQDLDIMTGAYAPEYGGETAAILNLTLRSGPIAPFAQTYVQGGEFATWNGGLTFGGQLGRPIGAPDAKGNVARAFGYFFDLTARTTDNALEAPQPDNQTAHNHGETQTYFGNFDLNAGSRDHFTLMINSAPGYTQVANRSGLSAAFASAGEGYGYGGLRNADGTLAYAANPSGIGVTTNPLSTQEQLGQDDYQRDVNDFGVLNWRHTLSSQLTSLLSVAVVHSGQNIFNDNPFTSLNSLPIDNSIEFNPTISRNYHHIQTQGSLTYASGAHTVKGGLLADQEEGDESYQLVPQSTFALDALEVIDPVLAPAATATGATDANGNAVYAVNAGATAPILTVHRSGFYDAGYIQDNWKMSRRFTANYGLRVDWYKQSQTVNIGAQQAAVDSAQVSPRINLAYQLAKGTIGRASYNRLFIQPPLAQGAIIGQAIQPETLNQYDVSVERQLTPNQVAKVAYYIKDMRNQIDTGLLIPNTQIGVFSSVNFTTGSVHGFELSWDLIPRNNTGWGSYLSYANSVAKPGGVINGQAGVSAPVYNDHDQLNTLSAGLNYTWKSGANAALDFYFGSGNGSSGISATNGPNTAPRVSNSHLNLVLSTGSGLFGGGRNGHGGVSLIVENLYDDRAVINFDSGFSGTRFEQGRRILFSAFGKF